MNLGRSAVILAAAATQGQFATAAGQMPAR